MKIRNGFVSNSSSSSFCVVGVEGDWAKKLLSLETNSSPPVRPNHGEDCECSKCKAWARKEESAIDDEVWHCFGYGHYCPTTGKTFLEYYGSYEGYVCAAGIDAKALLKDQSLSDAKSEFRDLIKRRFKLDIPLSSIDLHFGEAGDG